MIYQFKAGTRVPAGAEAAGVVAERDLIEERTGAATVDNAFTEVQGSPGDYPNLRAFGPSTHEEAWEIAVKEGIRKAFRSVVVVRERVTRGEARRVEIRWLHAPSGASGEREYQALSVIRADPGQLSRLLLDLENDAGAYYRKFENVLAEIREAIGS